MDVKRWLELQSQIDYLYYVLEDIVKKMPKAPIEQMIDEASGYDKKRIEDIRDICTQMKELKKEWSEVTGEEAPTTMEDKLLEVINKIDARSTAQ